MKHTLIVREVSWRIPAPSTIIFRNVHKVFFRSKTGPVESTCSMCTWWMCILIDSISNHSCSIISELGENMASLLHQFYHVNGWVRRPVHSDEVLSICFSLPNRSIKHPVTTDRHCSSLFIPVKPPKIALNKLQFHGPLHLIDRSPNLELTKNYS